MNRAYIIISALVLFFLGLFYWSIWWLIIAIIAGISMVAYRMHRVRMNKMEAEKDELELQLEEKTDQLESLKDKERKSRQQAEMSNNTKTAILAKIGHEIRTPLNGIMGMASLLAQTKLNSEQEQFSDSIKNCGERLLKVINEILIADILEFSKIESCKPELVQKDFDLQGCIGEVMDMFAGKASAGGLELMYEIDNNVPSQITGNSMRLRQVLMNLLSNAITFTHRGEIVVHVFVQKHEQNDEFELGFEVSDTGIGIEEEKLKKILHSMRYANSSLSANQNETNLGLVICEKLVSYMGGQIEIKSIFSKGTVVRFSIKTKAGKHLQRHGDFAMEAINGKKVLVIENNPTQQRILKNILEQRKLIPLLSNSTHQALHLLNSSDKPELVIIDIKMQGMDSVELACSIKNKYPSLPIILLCPEENQQWKKCEEIFDAVVAKPVKADNLAKHVANLLRHDSSSISDDKNNNQLLRSDFADEFPLRILIAEDDIFNQQLAKTILNKLGYEPSIACNGKEVLERVSNNQYDLILMDVQMPEMDGLETTRMIRLCLPSQPVIIAMTANAMQGDREECLQSGMDDYLSKPVELNELVTILKKWAFPVKEKIN